MLRVGGGGGLYLRYFFDGPPRYGAPGVELTGLHKETATVTQLHFLHGQVGGCPWGGLAAAPQLPHPPHCCVSPHPQGWPSRCWTTTRCISGRSARRRAAPTCKRPAASASRDAQGPTALSTCLGGSPPLPRGAAAGSDTEILMPAGNGAWEQPSLLGWDGGQGPFGGGSFLTGTLL